MIPTPPGYRFLMQLTHAKTVLDARQEIGEMFSLRYMGIALFKSGTFRLKQNGWYYTPTGFTVFLPRRINDGQVHV